MIDPPAVSLEIASRFAATIERRRLPLAALFTATGVSLLGRLIATVALPWAAYSHSGSLVHSGLTATCLIFPWLLADPTGNAFAARIGHKPASIAAGVMGGALIAAIPLLDLTARLPIASLLLIAVLFAYVTALGSAARHALVHEATGLAGASAERVRGVIQTVARLAIVAGAVLAALSITALGQDRTLWMASAMIAIAAAADCFLVPPVTPERSLGRSPFAAASATSTHRPAGTLEQP